MRSRSHVNESYICHWSCQKQMLEIGFGWVISLTKSANPNSRFGYFNSFNINGYFAKLKNDDHSNIIMPIRLTWKRNTLAKQRPRKSLRDSRDTITRSYEYAMVHCLCASMILQLCTVKNGGLARIYPEKSFGMVKTFVIRSFFPKKASEKGSFRVFFRHMQSFR